MQMKKRYWLTLAGFLAGAACALYQGVSGADVMTAVMKPFTALGRMLRAWSLSGTAGNALAWAVMIALSLLPVVYIMIARRKRKQKGDWLFILSGAGIFGGLFLLVNPTLPVHPVMTEALSSSQEVLTGGPVFAMFSLLLVSVVTRWTGGLTGQKKQDKRLILWTRALLAGCMALIAFSFAFSAAEGAQAVWGGVKTHAFQMMDVESSAVMDSDLSSGELSAWMGGQVSDPMQSLLDPTDSATETGAALAYFLSCILLIPDLFAIRTLGAALSLADSLGRGWFSGETEQCASVLAACARYALIASVACMAARNILTVLLGRWLLASSVSLSLPLEDLLLSCGAMLLARLIGAACRVKRDNDLMI